MSRRGIINLANFDQFTAINVSSDAGDIGGPVVAPLCAEIKLLFSLADAKACAIVLHGRYVGGFAGSVAQASAILTGLNSGAPWTALATFISADTAFGGVGIRNIDTPGNPYIFSTSAGALGSSASPALPNEVAVCATKRTGQTGPGARGRMYFPGWATNALGTGNVIAAGAVTDYQAWLNTIAGVLQAQGYTHCLALPARNQYTGSTGTVHPARQKQTLDVISVQVRDNHWDSQRRRGLK
jgi:hypothetical protein